MIRIVVGLLLAIVIMIVALLAFGPVYEPLASLVAADAAVQGRGWDGIPGDIQSAALSYVGRLFIAGMILLAVIRVLRRELLVTTR